MTGTGRRAALRRTMLALMFGVLAATLAAVMWLAPGAQNAQAQTGYDAEGIYERAVGGVGELLAHIEPVALL